MGGVQQGNILIITKLIKDSSNHDPKSGTPIPEAKIFKDDELVNMIDPILDSDDRDDLKKIMFIIEKMQFHWAILNFLPNNLQYFFLWSFVEPFNQNVNNLA